MDSEAGVHGRVAGPDVFMAHAESEKPFVKKVKDRVAVLAKARRVAPADDASSPGVPVVYLDADSFSAGRDDSLRTFTRAASTARMLALFVPVGGFQPSTLVAHELCAFLTGIEFESRDDPFPTELTPTQQQRATECMARLLIVDRHGVISWPAGGGPPSGLPGVCRNGALSKWFDKERPRLRSGSDRPDAVAAAVLAGFWGVDPESVRSRVAARRARIRTMVAGSIAVVVVLLTAITVFAMWQWGEAEAASARSISHALLVSAEGALEREPEVVSAILQRIPSSRSLDTHSARSALFRIAGTPRPLAVLRGHADDVTSACFAPTGNVIATGSRDATARLWDGDGDATRCFQLEHSVVAVAFDGAGGLVTVTDHGGVVRWRLDGSGRSELVAEGDATAGRLSSDARLCVLWREQAKELSFLDLTQTPVLSHTVRSKSHGLIAARFDTERARVLVALDGEPPALWTKPSTVTPIGNLFASAIDFAPKQDLVAIQGFAGRLQVRKISGEVLLDQDEDATLVEGYVSRSVAFSNGGDRVFATTQEGSIRGRLLKTPTVVNRLMRGHRDGVTSLVPDTAGKFLLSTSMDGTAQLWNLEGQTTSIRLLHGRGWVQQAAFSSDGMRVLTVGVREVMVWSADGGCGPVTMGTDTSAYGRPAAIAARSPRALILGRSAELWDVHDAPHLVVQLTAGDDVSSAGAIAPTGDFVAVGSRGGTCRVVRVVGDAATHVFTGAAPSPAEVSAIAVADDATVVAFGTSTGTVGIWRNKGGVRWIEAHHDRVAHLEFSSSSERLLSCSWDGEVRAWDADASSTTPRWSHRGHAEGSRVVMPHQRHVEVAHFRRDGAVVVTAGGDGTARLIDALTGRELACIVHGAKSVTDATFSPDGAWVATAGEDGIARIWDASDCGRAWREYDLRGGHFASGVAFTPDGRYLAASSRGGAVHLVPAREDGESIVLRPLQSLQLIAVAFTADGRGLLATDAFGRGLHWTIDPQLVLARAKQTTKTGLTVQQARHYLEPLSGRVSPR